MKKKKPIIFAALVVAAIVVIAVILQSSNWSNLSYEAVVQETVTMSNGEIRLIVERTTEIYGKSDTFLLRRAMRRVRHDAFPAGFPRSGLLSD